MDIIFFESPSEFHNWLEKNHADTKEIWIGFYKKDAGKKGITYPEAVDEALCFGWIDGIRKRVDDISYMNRFTPRKPRSNWSEVNIKRVGELSDGANAPLWPQSFSRTRSEKHPTIFI